MPTVTPPAGASEIICLECVVPSCSADYETSYERAILLGWRSITRSKEKTRTHLGWCKKCAKKFGVER